MPRITNHTQGEGFPCGHCDAVFTRTNERTRHEKRHKPYTERPFECDSCSFRANQKSGLTCHKNSVHLKKRIPCRDPGCDRSFSDPGTLSRHMSRRHRLSSKKRNPPPWDDFTNIFSVRKATATFDATVASPSIRKSSFNGDHITKVERRSPDVSSANVTLHTTPLGRQEGFSGQDLLLDSAHYSFAPSSTLSPLLGSTYQPDWQFQSSSGFYPSGLGIDYPSCSTAMLPELTLPEKNLNGLIPPCGFQIGVGMPDAYGTDNSVDKYFDTLLEMPVDDFLPQSSTNSSFAMAPNTIFPDPSLMVPLPMSNYDATFSGPDLFCGTSQRWHFDTPPLNFGYADARGTEYSRFNGLSSLNF